MFVPAVVDRNSATPPCGLTPREQGASNVQLPAADSAFVPRIATIADQNDARAFSQLSARERRELIAALKKLVVTNKL
jgi:hypothetical protein